MAFTPIAEILKTIPRWQLKWLNTSQFSSERLYMCDTLSLCYWKSYRKLLSDKVMTPLGAGQHWQIQMRGSDSRLLLKNNHRETVSVSIQIKGEHIRIKASVV